MEDLGHHGEVLAAGTGQTGGLGENQRHVVTQQEHVLPQKRPRPQELQLCHKKIFILSNRNLAGFSALIITYQAG